MQIALKSLCLAASFIAMLWCQACNQTQTDNTKTQTDNKEVKTATKKVQAEPTATSENAPKLTIIGGDTHEFSVKQGEIVEHVFKIRNDGKGDLKLLKARGS